MRSYGFITGLAENVFLEQQLGAASKTLDIAAGKSVEKRHVIIAWPGTAMDGMDGIVEGKKENGDNMVRLTFSGAIIHVPEYNLIQVGVEEVKTGVSKQEVKAGIKRLESGRWKDTNGNSYDTLEEAAEAEAHNYMFGMYPETGQETPGYKHAHAEKKKEILSKVGEIQGKQKITAAPEKKSPPAEPASRGASPQEEELSKRAKEEKKEMEVPPTELSRVKPKAVTKELAQASPEAGTPVQTLLEQILALETQKAEIEKQIEDFRTGLNPELVDQKYVESVGKLYDMMKETGEPVLKVKDQILAIDVKRDIVEANMSEETRREYKKLMEGIAAASADLKKQNKDLKALVDASFKRMGGVERAEGRVAMFPGASLIEWVSALQVKGKLDEGQEKKRQVLEAGLKEMFKALVQKGKDILDTLKGLVKTASSFARSYERDVKNVGSGVNAAKTYKVIMESDEYGAEEFEYDTPEEAQAGLERLKKSAEEHEKKDGIKREVYMEANIDVSAVPFSEIVETPEEARALIKKLKYGPQTLQTIKRIAELERLADSNMEAAKTSPAAQEFMQKHIPKHLKKGMERDQAVRVAYEEARKKGFKVPEIKAALSNLKAGGIGLLSGDSADFLTGLVYSNKEKTDKEILDLAMADKVFAEEVKEMGLEPEELFEYLNDIRTLLLYGSAALGIKAMWVGRVQDNWFSLEELESAESNYGVASRLGYEGRVNELWEDNPYVVGGVNPADLKVVEDEAKVKEMMEALDADMLDAEFREKFLTEKEVI